MQVFLHPNNKTASFSDWATVLDFPRWPRPRSAHSMIPETALASKIQFHWCCCRIKKLYQVVSKVIFCDSAKSPYPQKIHICPVGSCDFIVECSATPSVPGCRLETLQLRSFDPQWTRCVLLGPQGPLVLPLVNPPVRNENLDTYIQAYMPHESSGDSSNQPIGHMGSPRRLP